MRFLLTKILFQKRALIMWWFIGMIALSIIMMYFFPFFKNSNMAASLSSLPSSVQKLIGDQGSWSTISGYITEQIFALRAPLLISVLSIFIFTALITGDEKKGLTETQLSLSNGRTWILINKFLAGTLIVSIALAGTFLGILAGLLLVHSNYSAVKILILTVNCLILCLDLGLVSLLFGCLFGSNGLAVAVASLYAFSSYLVSSMVDSVSSLRIVDKFSLFHYYTNASTFDLRNLIVLISFGVVCLVVGLIGFSYRDIKTNS